MCARIGLWNGRDVVLILNVEILLRHVVGIHDHVVHGIAVGRIRHRCRDHRLVVYGNVARLICRSGWREGVLSRWLVVCGHEAGHVDGSVVHRLFDSSGPEAAVVRSNNCCHEARDGWRRLPGVLAGLVVVGCGARRRSARSAISVSLGIEAASTRPNAL